MKVQFFNRNKNAIQSIELPDTIIDCIEIRFDKGERVGPYSNVEIGINVNTDAIVVLANKQKIAMHEIDNLCSEAEINEQNNFSLETDAH